MTTRADQLHHLARSYVTEALGKGDFDAIPYSEDVTLRAPLCPGGSGAPLRGRSNLREQWWALLPQLFVHASHFDRVVDALVPGARQTCLGHGFAAQATMGPLVSREQLERVSGYVAGAALEGAQTTVGGKRGQEPGYYYEPTVAVNAAADHRIMREEVFGPVVAAVPFRSVEEVIAAANHTTYGLAAGVWTRDLQKAHRVAHALKASTVWINTYHVYDNALPFGGYKQSGWGRELGKAALEHYYPNQVGCGRTLTEDRDFDAISNQDYKTKHTMNTLSPTPALAEPKVVRAFVQEYFDA